MRKSLTIFFFALLLGIGCGYWWAFSALRPTYRERMLEKDATIQRLTLRLMDAEGKVKIVRGRGKK